jgi:hypothetical protein
MRGIHIPAIACSSLLVLSGCTPMTPTLYPNDHLQKVGGVQAERDVAECQALAEEWVKSGGQGAQIAKDTARNVGVGTAVGAASGAAGGAIYGDPARGAAAGAAGGAAAGLMGTLFGWMFSKSEPEPVYRNFVEKCLRDRGYDPIGWQ